MGKRKFFLLFISAMSLSIIIMVIIYGVFIKDIDFSFNVKTPESAPSPVDMYNQDQQASKGDESDSKNPAKVTTPDEAAKNQAKTETANGEKPNGNDLQSVVPLEPQVNSGNNTPSTQTNPDEAQDITPPEEVSPSTSQDTSSPSLHYVYLDGFSSKDAAEQAIQELQDRNLPSQPNVRMHKGQIIVQFGVFSDKENAAAMVQQLRTQNVYVKVD
jgi:cytoskeletal protein RodZ